MPRGEDRPAEHPAHKPGEPEFFGIKLLRAEHAEDGTLRAWPVPGRPGSPESFEANAYYMLPNGPGIEAPKPGDVICVAGGMAVHIRTSRHESARFYDQTVQLRFPAPTADSRKTYSDLMALNSSGVAAEIFTRAWTDFPPLV